MKVLMVVRKETFDYSFFSKNINKITESFYNININELPKVIDEYKEYSWIINTSYDQSRFDIIKCKKIKNISVYDMKLLSYYYKSGLEEEIPLVYYDLEDFGKANILIDGKILKGSNNNAGRTLGKDSKQLNLWLSEIIGKYLKLYKSILKTDDNFNSLYIAYKKNDYVAVKIFAEVILMIEEDIKTFILLLDPKYVVLGAGSFKLKRQLLVDIVEMSPYLKSEKSRIKLDVRCQNIILGLLVE